MGIKYSELPKTSAPTNDDYVAILDNETATLKTTSLQNAVDSTLGTADISALGDGTVKGAIVAAASSGGDAGKAAGVVVDAIEGLSATNVQEALVEINESLGGFSLVSCTQSEYDALTTKSPTTIYLIKADEV